MYVFMQYESLILSLYEMYAHLINQNNNARKQIALKTDLHPLLADPGSLKFPALPLGRDRNIDPSALID